MYALIHNNQIQVGPRSWLLSAFREYLEEEGLDASDLPRNAPTEPLITSAYSVLPVTITEVNFDKRFEQPAGPFLTIEADKVTGFYEKVDLPIQTVKQNLKAIVASNRYNREIAGTTVTLQNQVLNIYTNREDRNTYLDAFLLAPNEGTFNFKFPLSGDIFLAVNKAELGAIVQAVTLHVQDAFSWESMKTAEIDALTTVEELKTVVLTYAS